MILFENGKHRLTRLLLNFKSFKDNSGVYIGKGSIIANNTFINDGTRINGKIIIKGQGNTKIGKYCAIGDGVKIISSNHDSNVVNLQYALQKKILKTTSASSKKDVTIGHNVWIGDNAMFLAGVTIGNGSIIAAGSVVTKNVPAYTIYGGIPAKFLKDRFDKERVKEIETSRWWDWPLAKMIQNRSFFE